MLDSNQKILQQDSDPPRYVEPPNKSSISGIELYQKLKDIFD